MAEWSKASVLKTDVPYTGTKGSNPLASAFIIIKNMISKQLSNIVYDYYLKGRLDEDFVMDAIKHTLGGNVKRADENTDINNHIDFWWESPKKGWIGIDVKGLKKNDRNDNYFDDSIQWLELVNVNGNEGWLYGKAEYIAFRTNNKIIFNKRNKLLNFILDKTKQQAISSENPKDCYVLYQRKQRKDVIVKVPTKDIEDLADFAIIF